MDIFTALIMEICAEEGIACQALSHGWILRLTYKNNARHIVGRHFDVNTAAADRIACDKYACCIILQNSGVPVIEHEMLFDPAVRTNWIGETGEWARALAFFEKYGLTVVKPNNGWQGRHVYLCENAKQLERAVTLVFQEEPNACLCPFYDFTHEYRVFYVNGHCPYVYGKTRAHVTGDGINDLKTLAAALKLPEDSLRFPRDTTDIPQNGEILTVSWKHNLSNGAAVFEVAHGALLDSLTSLAEKAARQIGITFATVDIARLADGTLKIVEINAGVTAKKLLEQHPERRDLVKDIYREAVCAMFSERK